MSKLHVVLPSGTIFKEDGSFYEGIESFLKTTEYELIFTSHDRYKCRRYKKKLEEVLGREVIFPTRQKVKEVFKKTENLPLLRTTIVVGSIDYDLFLATQFKLLFIQPQWTEKKEDKASYYGFHVKSIDDLDKYIKILDNQTEFYYKLKIDEKATLYALTSANTYGVDLDESQMIDKFRSVLKEGNRSEFEALFLHLISSVMKDEDLRKIDIWGVMPSSDCELNSDMVEIKERCRYLTAKRMKEAIFIRHTGVNKSHFTSPDERLRIGASKHLESIMINPYYRTRLKGKTVCILDDYITNGISFEALRNLLIAAGVEKIYFFAFGRFKKGPLGVYQKEDYRIEGDIFSDTYRFQLESRDSNFGDNGILNDKAKIEVRNIKKILDDSKVGN